MKREELLYALALFILLGIVDPILTYVGVKHFGLIEANVLIGLLIQYSWEVFFLFKLMVYGGLAWLTLCFSRFPSGLLITYLGIGVVFWNALMIFLTF
jgi:hypothetical protein